jgi:hypothetical protein
MKKIIIGLAALAGLASPALARDYHRAGNATYSMSGKMRGENAAAVSGVNASYAAAADTSINQRERDRAEAALYR